MTTATTLFSIALTDKTSLRKFEPELTAKNPDDGETYTLKRMKKGETLPKWWPKEWKACGKVSVDVLDNDNGKPCFVVLRQEATKKELSNFSLHPDLTFQFHPSSDRSIMWVTKDNVGGTIRDTTLCLTFKTNAFAKKFLKCVKKHQKS